MNYEYLRRFRYNFPNRKFFQLIDKVYDLRNLEKSWKSVKANKGCAGVDKQTLEDFGKRREQYFQEVQRAIKRKAYEAAPVLRKYIPKANKKKRPLGIPTVRDRVLQQAMRNVIEPIFEMKFLDCSYGFRPERSAHQAIEAIRGHLDDGYRWVIDADISSFFDCVDHEVLRDLVAKEISDGKVLGLIESWLTAGVMEEGVITTNEQGTPQGGVISPLLANIYLHEMDREITKIPVVRLVRYADDFVILCRSKWVAQQVMGTLRQKLGQLKLTLSEEKTKIVNAEEETFEFLGFSFGIRRGKLWVRPRKKSVKRYKERVRLLTRRKQPIKGEQMVGRLNYTIRGWGNYFRIGEVRALFKELDVWVRMRVRCFIEKKKSNYANARIPNHVLQSEYKLASLATLL